MLAPHGAGLDGRRHSKTTTFLATFAALATGVLAFPALASAATISGQVTAQAGGTPIPGMCVNAQTTGGAVVTSTSTDGSGNYTMFLSPGQYKVLVVDCRFAVAVYISRWYDVTAPSANGYDFNSADTINLPSAGTNVTGIYVALEVGSKISGRVTSDGTNGIQSVCVEVVKANDEQAIVGSGFLVLTNASGNYLTEPLPPGNKKVRFKDCTVPAPPNYISEWWNDKPSFASADNILLMAGTNTTNVNAQLAEGQINVVKDAVPNDAQNFNFTAGGGLTPTSFQLDDDSDPALSNTRSFTNVDPGGGYSISEGAAGGWYLGQAVCNDGSLPSNINVSSGETVTCTFTNSKDYPRPGGATPIRVPLVPSFNECTSPNSTHVAPLDRPSCAPAALSSAVLTTSTIGQGSGSVRYDVELGDPLTPEDEADLNVLASVSDVRNRSDGTDYTGNLILDTVLRVTDRANDVSGTASATAADTPFGFPMTCVPTSSTSVGSNCSFAGSVDSFIPGFAVERNRAVISLRGIRVLDAGPDGTVAPDAGSCPYTCGSGDEAVFASQGVFAP